MDNYLTDDKETRVKRRLLLMEVTLRQVAHGVSRDTWLTEVKRSLNRNMPDDFTPKMYNTIYADAERLVNGIYDLAEKNDNAN